MDTRLMKAANSLVNRLLTILFLFLAVMLGLVPGPSLAQTTETATTTSGGNWTNTSTWNCSNNPCFPNNSPSFVYDVFINGGGVLLNSSSTPTSITVDTLSLNAGILTLQNGATLAVNTNGLSSSGTLTVGNGRIREPTGPCASSTSNIGSVSHPAKTGLGAFR